MSHLSPSGDVEDALMSEVTTPADSEVEGPWSSASSSPVDGLADDASAEADAVDAPEALPPVDEDDDESVDQPTAAQDDGGYSDEDEADGAEDAEVAEGLGEGTAAEEAVFALLALQGRLPSPATSTSALSLPPTASPVVSFGAPPPPTHVTGSKRRADHAFGLSAPRARASPVPRPEACGDFKYICKYDGCGKSYASTDAVSHRESPLLPAPPPPRDSCDQRPLLPAPPPPRDPCDSQHGLGERRPRAACHPFNPPLEPPAAPTMQAWQSRPLRELRHVLAFSCSAR